MQWDIWNFENVLLKQRQCHFNTKCIFTFFSLQREGVYFSAPKLFAGLQFFSFFPIFQNLFLYVKFFRVLTFWSFIFSCGILASFSSHTQPCFEAALVGFAVNKWSEHLSGRVIDKVKGLNAAFLYISTDGTSNQTAWSELSVSVVSLLPEEDARSSLQVKAKPKNRNDQNFNSNLYRRVRLHPCVIIKCLCVCPFFFQLHPFVKPL